MLNYIILVLLTAVLILSAVTVIAEPIFAGYKGVGRILREIRIRLRAISWTSFCVWAGVIVIFALAVGDDETLCGELPEAKIITETTKGQSQ